MYVRNLDRIGQAAAAATIGAADSTLVNQVVTANLCGVARTKGNPDVRPQADITQVVIHTLIGTAATYINRWHGGQNCFPPHYVINKSGEITQMVAENHLAQHAGLANSNAIGIEHEGGCYNSPSCFSQDLYLASAGLVRDICQRNNIPKDRTHIIGHDEVRGTGHGDPGGYWDWEYYMALLQWDGSTANQKPLRIVLDYNSLDVWPLTNHWHEANRLAMAWGPSHRQSYASKYFHADPDSKVPDNDAVQYMATIPEKGSWSLSAWWPVLSDNNKAVSISVTTTNRDPAQRTLSAIYDQSARTLMSRKTVALPSTHTWMNIHTFNLDAGDDITIQVSRRSAARGRVVADAFRLMRT
jgi:N-acetylmuramoyl-L-alanine amidase